MLFEKKTIHFILPLVSLLKVFSLYKITAYVHLGLPSLWFVGAVFVTKYWVPAHSCFLSATVVHWHKWSLFSACALLSTSCSLCKRVCPYQLASSSDYSGLLLCPCWWNLWVKLMTAARVYNSYTAVLTGRGYCLNPLLLCCLGRMYHSSSWMRKFLGVLGAHLLLFTHIPWMFGQAWGPTAKTRSWAFLGWALAPD